MRRESGSPKCEWSSANSEVATLVIDLKLRLGPGAIVSKTNSRESANILPSNGIEKAK